jgi:hypothetical protein
VSFKDQLNQDLGVFFNNDEFTESATLANGISISVYFDEKDDVVFDTGLDSDVSASVVSVTCKADDVSDLNHGDSLILNTMTYYIIDMDPPQSGVRKIYLSEDRP